MSEAIMANEEQLENLVDLIQITEEEYISTRQQIDNEVQEQKGVIEGKVEQLEAGNALMKSIIDELVLSGVI